MAETHATQARLADIRTPVLLYPLQPPLLLGSNAAASPAGLISTTCYLHPLPLATRVSHQKPTAVVEPPGWLTLRT
jgi:hypothetical protein